MEFILNLIFFVTLPCILICDALKKMVLYCNAIEKKQDGRYRKNEEKKCFSSHDAQVRAYTKNITVDILH